MFAEEKQLLQLLEHKNILSPLEYRQGETIKFQAQGIIIKNIAIMKYKQNGDLMNEVIKNGKLD